MAISAPHYNALKELYRRGELPQGARILEIGEANWYGDMPADELANDYNHRCGGDLADFCGFVDRLNGVKSHNDLFGIAKLVYEVFFDSSLVHSVDLDGTESASRADLNYELTGYGIYQVCINHGTAEHIFNIANVFLAMHDNCALHGLMIHEAPFQGWIDHGFYNLQPTLFYDLAAANDYDIRYFAITRVGEPEPLEIESREHIHNLARAGDIQYGSMLFVVLRKTTDGAFRIPMQNIYDCATAETAKAWSELR